MCNGNGCYVFLDMIDQISREPFQQKLFAQNPSFAALILANVCHNSAPSAKASGRRKGLVRFSSPETLCLCIVEKQTTVFWHGINTEFILRCRPKKELVSPETLSLYLVEEQSMVFWHRQNKALINVQKDSSGFRKGLARSSSFVVFLLWQV